MLALRARCHDILDSKRWEAAAAQRSSLPRKLMCTGCYLYVFEYAVQGRILSLYVLHPR